MWKKGGSFSLALAQGGSRNWAPGGDRFSLAVNSFLTLYANKTINRRHWDNSVEATYGLVNTTLAGVIKNDDKLDILSRWSYELGKQEVRKWRLSVLANIRTQLTDGFDYDEAERRRISAFLAPGIVVLSPGVAFYSKDQAFNVHVSPVAARWVMIANRPYELGPNYGVEPNEEVKIEAGPFVSVNLNKEILKNVTYRTRLDLASDFVAKEPANVDVFWTNMLQMKINKYLGVVYNLDVQYDDNTTIFGYSNDRPGTQLKSILGVGLAVSF